MYLTWWLELRSLAQIKHVFIWRYGANYVHKHDPSTWSYGTRSSGDYNSDMSPYVLIWTNI